ncbi:MAG: TolC family protein, partial [Candidatus Omnitrophota bacterium]
MRTKPFIVIVSVFIAVSFSSFSSSCYADEALPLKPLGFNEFYQKVLAYYPKLKQQGSNVEIAIARKFQAQAGFLPRIQALASMATGNDQVYVFGTLLKQRAFTQSDFELHRLNNPASRTNYNIGVHAEMPLFDALQTIYKVKEAKHMVESARYDEAFSRMEALLVASDAYSHTLAVEKLLDVVEGSCKNSEADIKQAEELKDKGMVLGADFYAAKVILGSLRNIRNELRGQKESMHALLNILMGEDPLGAIELVDTIQEGAADKKDLKEWLSEAYRSRPDLLSIKEAVYAQEAVVSRERASILPNISAFGDLNENTQNFDTGGGSFAVGIKGSIDIFDPAYSSRIKIARESLKKLEYDKNIAKDSITKDITDEYSRFGSIQANLPILHEMAGDSGQAVDLTLPLYREGRKSIADLLGMRQGNIA